jgi:plastocyanin
MSLWKLAGQPWSALIVLLALVAAARADVNVVNSSFVWVPAHVVVEEGQSVHWAWTGLHNVAEVDGPADNVWNGTGFRSGSATNGGAYSVTFAQTGLHYYVCELHAAMGMRGTVLVVPAGTLHTVVGSGTTWSPANLTLNPGDTVFWRWTGSHNVAEVNGPADNNWNGTGFRSGAATNGGSYSQTFTTPGLRHYVCEIHAAMGMRGTISVPDPCADPMPLPTSLQIAYDVNSHTVNLSWDAVSESMEGCPITPLYTVWAGATPDALAPLTETMETFLTLPAIDRACYEITVRPAGGAN